MNFKLLDALMPVTGLATVGGLFYSLRLLRHGKKKGGYCVILISVGWFLLLDALLTNLE
jgi:hypothetical protein